MKGRCQLKSTSYRYIPPGRALLFGTLVRGIGFLFLLSIGVLEADLWRNLWFTTIMGWGVLLEATLRCWLSKLQPLLKKAHLILVAASWLTVFIGLFAVAYTAWGESLEEASIRSMAAREALTIATLAVPFFGLWELVTITEYRVTTFSAVAQTPELNTEHHPQDSE